MRYFLDCEFIEQGAGKPVELLSLAVVAEDGRWFYGVNGEADRSGANAWVKEHVFPHLYKEDEFHWHDLRNNLLHLVGDDPSPEFWGWCCGYDYVLVSQLVGFDRWPPEWPYYFRDVQQIADQHDFLFPDQPKSGEHNALVDARWVKRLWEYAMEVSP